jgi:hypothetical protein
MNRLLYLAGFAYIGLCATVIVRAVRARQVVTVTPGVATTPTPAPTPPVRPSGSSGEQWFAAIKPYCNPVEVEVQTRYNPAPSTGEGAGYSAACFALAGKIERARTIIDGMASNDRGAAANVLFNVAHPVADAGDDRASGPMMELVLDYWPNNYMALYHAGMSEYSLGQPAVAEKHLRAFLGMYSEPDGFTNAARAALAKIEAGDAPAAPGGKPVVERESPARP